MLFERSAIMAAVKKKEPLTLSDEEKFCLEGCGSYWQYHHVRSNFEHGICPFCVRNPINVILHENTYWMLWENPYKNTRHCKTMLVIVLKQHVRSLVDMNLKQWTYLEDMLLWATQKFKLSGGVLLMRFGDMRENAGTVPHLHFNLWVPDGTGEVRIPVFKDPKNREKNKERAAAFAARYEVGEVPDKRKSPRN